MSTNSNRVTGGILIFLAIGMSFFASAWPADSEYRFLLWSTAATFFGSGVILGQIGMMQDIQSGVEDIKKDLAALASKIDSLQNANTDVKNQTEGHFREQT